RRGTLRPGLRVVVTLDAGRAPDVIGPPLVEKGLYAADRISSRTSLAVCAAPGAARGRAAFARKKGLELVPYARLEELLADVRPGRPVGGGAPVAEAQGSLF